MVSNNTYLSKMIQLGLFAVAGFSIWTVGSYTQSNQQEGYKHPKAIAGNELRIEKRRILSEQEFLRYESLEEGESLKTACIIERPDGTSSLEYRVRKNNEETVRTGWSKKRPNKIEEVKIGDEAYHTVSKLYMSGPYLEIYRLAGTNSSPSFERDNELESNVNGMAKKLDGILESVNDSKKVNNITDVFKTSVQKEIFYEAIKITMSKPGLELMKELYTPDLSATSLVASPETWAAQLVTLYTIGKINPNALKGVHVIDIFGKEHVLGGHEYEREKERINYINGIGFSADNPYLSNELLAQIKGGFTNSVPDTAVSWEWEDRQRKEMAAQRQLEKQAQMLHAWQQGGKNMERDIEPMAETGRRIYREAEQSYNNFQGDVNRSIRSIESNPDFQRFQQDATKAINNTQQAVDNAARSAQQGLDQFIRNVTQQDRQR